jgi:hypothetical protein
MLNKEAVDFFWSKVSFEPNTGCWLWFGGMLAHGYGQMANREGKVVGVHRFSWVLHFGPIPKGMMVLHKCDERSCVNPAHLFLGTALDNSHDMMKKGRHWRQRLAA